MTYKREAKYEVVVEAMDEKEAIEKIKNGDFDEKKTRESMCYGIFILDAVEEDQ